jgi:nucleotide-binding universal stress UspA family protein
MERERAGTHPMNLGDVLFATDFSPASERAALVAADMARLGGVALHVVHVVPPVTDAADSDERLKNFAARLGDGRVRTALLSGRVAHQIIRYARQEGIGLIVLGTHGRTGVSRVLLGSVAESVVRLAQCPVLTVPAAAAEGAPVEAAITAALVVQRCIVCGAHAEELICEPCRTRIRGEALEQKLDAERAGRRGSPA